MAISIVVKTTTPTPPACPASANAGTEFYGPISNLDCAINEDPFPEDPPGLPTGTTARLTVPYSELNYTGSAWEEVEVTLQAHPTLDLVVENFIMGHRDMGGNPYDWDGGPVFQVPLFTISAGVDFVAGPASFFVYDDRDLIFEISYNDNEGGDWVPLSTNKPAGHYLYTVSPIPVTYTLIANDTGKRGIVKQVEIV